MHFHLTVYLAVAEWQAQRMNRDHNSCGVVGSSIFFSHQANLGSHPGFASYWLSYMGKLFKFEPQFPHLLNENNLTLVTI